jgi:hypothetical protein
LRLNKAQIMQEGRCGVSTRPTRRQHVPPRFFLITQLRGRFLA